MAEATAGGTAQNKAIDLKVKTNTSQKASEPRTIIKIIVEAITKSEIAIGSNGLTAETKICKLSLKKPIHAMTGGVMITLSILQEKDIRKIRIQDRTGH